MMTFTIYGKIKAMSQTTKQINNDQTWGYHRMYKQLAGAVGVINMIGM
jgi:hypothetical protein